MPGTNVTLPDSDPVEVKLCTDKGGIVSLGIRYKDQWEQPVSPVFRSDHAGAGPLPELE